MADVPSYRLPRTVRPIRYDLEIAPDLAEARFSGDAAVTVMVEEPVDTFVLNAAEVTVRDLRLTLADGSEATGRATFDEPLEQVRFAWDRVVPAGPATLRFRFAGVLNDKLRGFYRSTFPTRDGQVGVLASTQCEATDCRRIFPCWDEPDFKAVFALRLVVDRDLMALSNAPAVKTEELSNGKKRVIFAETIKMSSYLVAMAVGPFRATEPVMVDGTPVRIVAREDRMPLSAWAETAARHALSWFREYFAIPYPGQKLDHIAIPDFAFGAMENLGLVTYRETALLVDPERASQAERRGVQSVIAHETAHMWFGDLVTMRWWNGIWLNEAFASFMQMLCSDAFEPRWDVWTTFGVERAAALATDGTASTRAIEAPVGPVSDALDMLDGLTYSKGAAVLRQIEQYLGPDAFREGIRLYLRRHQYGNTESRDLWDALETASGEPARAIMEAWVSQGGHPLVTVRLDENGHTLHVSQQHFRYRDAGDGRLWPVPVTLLAHAEDGGTETVRLLLRDAAGTLDVGRRVDWVVLNPGASGFYRGRYEGVLWERLLDHVGVLSARDRLALVADVWALVLAGRLRLKEAVRVFRTFPDERNADVWAAAARALALLDKIARDSERPALRDLVRFMARPVFDALGFDARPGEDEATARVRAQVIRLLGTLGEDAEIRNGSLARYRAHRRGEVRLSGDLLPAVVEVAAAAGGPSEWEAFYEEFRRADTPQAVVRYLAALGGFQDPPLIRRALELYLSSEVRTQDAPGLIARVLASRAGQHLAWDAVEAHWEEMERRFPVNALGGLVRPVAEFVDDELSARADRFLDAHPVHQAKRQLAQVRETKDIHLAFARRVRGTLAAELA